MSRVSACRVCLSSELNMYAIADTPLQAVYEKLTGSELQSADARPACVCYICLHQLRKCDSFIRRAVKADTLLIELADTDLGITNESIAMIGKKSNDIKWMFKMSNVVHITVAEKQALELIQVKEENIKREMYEACEGAVDSDDLNAVKHKLDAEAEAEDEAAESADADNTSENSARQNVAKYNEKTCENQRNKGPPFLILKRLNPALLNNMSLNTKNVKDIIKEGIVKNVDSKPRASPKSSDTLSRAVPENKVTKSNDKKSVLTKLLTEERPYKCEYCSKCFGSEDKLASHIRIHTREKRYKCKHCDFSSLFPSSVVIHTRIHTGEKPYKCKHCDYSSSFRSSVIVHTRTHTGEKPYKCEHCSYSCNDLGLLKRHARTHTGEKPYKCKYCDYSSYFSKSVVIHTRIHTGEKPYKCERCSYSSKDSSALKRHVRTHTGEKPYKCNHCDYSANRKHHMIGHMRTHTWGKTLYNMLLK